MLYACSTLAPVKSCTIEKPLIIMLGIGEFDGMPNLTDSVKRDYMNVIHTFCDIWGYTILYATDDGAMRYMNRNTLNGEYFQNFKMKWSATEIEKFTEIAREQIISNEHDSMIYIISGHGDRDGVILDSDCKEIQLLTIYYEFWAKQCKYLCDKPKIIIVDACRGSAQATLFKKAALRGTNNDKNKNRNKSIKNSKNKDEKFAKIMNELKSAHDETKDLINEANFRYVFGNPEGYAVIEGGNFGGYLIRSIKHVLTKEFEKQSNTPVIHMDIFGRNYLQSQSLNELIGLIRAQADKLVGKKSKQLVDDQNLMEYHVYFKTLPNNDRRNNKSGLSQNINDNNSIAIQSQGHVTRVGAINVPNEESDEKVEFVWQLHNYKCLLRIYMLSVCLLLLRTKPKKTISYCWFYS